MQSIKKVYLHIGCGKTGSSSIQVWLSNVVAELAAQGVSYPLHNSKPLSDYAISSGNGFELLQSIINEQIEPYFARWAKQMTGEYLLYSSEQFQNLTVAQWQQLINFLHDRGIELQIVAFVRDVYDIAYSSYLQLLKRHTYTESFQHFVLSQTTLQQFSVAKSSVRST